jgi:hypothetical protein
MVDADDVGGDFSRWHGENKVVEEEDGSGDRGTHGARPHVGREDLHRVRILHHSARINR